LPVPGIWRTKRQLQPRRGTQALYSNTTGFDNVASGVQALYSNTTGSDNVASGITALDQNTAGNGNVASGFEALFQNTTGANNVGLGFGAGASLTTGSHNVDIANTGVAGEAGKIRIGTKGVQSAAYLAGVSGKSIAGPAATVLVNRKGQLGTATSSERRLKRDIHPLRGAGSRRLLSLRPVSYRYRRGSDQRQYGLIAGQGARRLPALGQYGHRGQATGVYYQELPALLLAQVKRQQQEIQQLRKEVLRRR